MKNTKTIDMTAIVAKATELDFNIESVQREYKRLASVITRLKKMPGRSDYNEKMTVALQEYQLIKSVRDYIQGPKQNVNTLTEEQIALFDYDECQRALDCIRSKKSHTKWLTTEPGDNDEYREACRIEELIKARKSQVKPVSDTAVRKSDLNNLIETLRGCSDLDAETALNKISELLK